MPLLKTQPFIDPTTKISDDYRYFLNYILEEFSRSHAATSKAEREHTAKILKCIRSISVKDNGDISK